MWKMLRFPLVGFAALLVAVNTAPAQDDDGGGCPREACAFGTCSYNGNFSWCTKGPYCTEEGCKIKT